MSRPMSSRSRSSGTTISSMTSPASPPRAAASSPAPVPAGSSGRSRARLCSCGPSAADGGPRGRCTSPRGRHRPTPPHRCAKRRPWRRGPHHVSRVGRLAFMCRGGADPARAVQAVAEGLVLGCFEDRRYKSDREDPALRECIVVADEADGADLPASAARGRTLAAAANAARELANEPSNVLTPRVFADRAAALVGGGGRRRGDPRRGGHPVARDGPAARRRAWQQRAAAPARDAPRAAAREGEPRPRARRQGRDVRHRGHLHQARRGHGADEGGHGGRRCRRRRDARHRSAPGALPG